MRPRAGAESGVANDQSAQRPGTELETRRDMLPAELVAPTRAGAIVAEFVNSIVEEAQARAFEVIRAAANEDDAGQREALESADRMRARIDTIAEELETAIGQLRQESHRLAELHEQTTFAAIAGTALEGDTGEREALAQVAAGLERGEAAEVDRPPAEEDDDGEPHEVEVVGGVEDDEAEAAADEEGYPAAETVEAEAEEELDAEPVAMADEEPMASESPVAEEPAMAPSGQEEPTEAVTGELDTAGAETEAAAGEAPEAAGAEAAGPEAPEVAGADLGPAADEEPVAEAEPAALSDEQTGLAEPEPEAEPAGAESAEPAAASEEAEAPAAAHDDVEPGPEELLSLDHPVAEPADEPESDVPAPEQLSAAAPSEADESQRLSEDEELAQDQERFARMSDVELAHAYSNALDQMDLQPAESESGARLLRYAGSALGEALTRPTFADIGQGPPALEPVPRMGRRRRRRAEAVNTLRRACAQAIEEISAEEPAPG
jgi:hypothetical protein